MEKTVTQAKPKTFGVLAEFAGVKEVYHAAEKVRDKGFKKWDVHSPFPIHGIDHAMGIGDSRMGWIAFFGAMAGCFGGFGLQYWINMFAQPVVIGGKPLNPYPAFIPVMYHALFKSKNFGKFSDNGFFISIEAKDPKFNVNEVQKLLADIGGRNIEVLED
ncbi:MAG: DUF3341 domain-containing protein [Fibrobacteres bacterium]|nr:DUF3341 domain-containing protein [Fibrobacterota bacterium]